MDRIIKSYINNYLNSNNIVEKDESKQFELFATFCVVARHYRDIYEIDDIQTGGGNDCGVDAIAIICNGNLIDNQEALSDMLSDNSKIYDCKLIFIQAKTSSNFDTGDMKIFGDGVEDLLIENSKLKHNEMIEERYKIISSIIDNAFSLEKMPECYLYYVTTGKWCDDTNCIATINNIKNRLNGLNELSKISFIPVDAIKLQEYYKTATIAPTAKIDFKNNVLVPDIECVNSSYIGFVEINDMFNLILDETGTIREDVFIDNVRAFQGNNEINTEILNSAINNPDKFVLMNNGVTIICKELKTVKSMFYLQNYQIVNGCQTLHVLSNCDTSKLNGSKLYIPVKIIETVDESFINEIIRSTNRQTNVSDDQFLALDSFNKRLEEYYKTYNDDSRLYYERRSKQYSFDNRIEKNRIITIKTQIKSIAAFALDLPHMSSRFYGKLVKDKRIFNDSNKLILYYTSSYLYYKLNLYFNRKTINKDYKKFIYFIISILRYQVIGNFGQLNSKDTEDKCIKVLNIANNDVDLFNEVQKAIYLLNNTIDISDKEITKNSNLIKILKNSIL